MASAAATPIITPIHRCVGARVEGVDLARRVSGLAFRKIFDAFQEFSVLVMHRTTLASESPTADPPFAHRLPAGGEIVPEGVGVTA